MDDNIIKNAWLLPISENGVYNLHFLDNLYLQRIYSGKYVSEKLRFKLEDRFIESLNDPGAILPTETEDNYQNFMKNLNELISGASNAPLSNNYDMHIDYNNIKSVEFYSGDDQNLGYINIICDNSYKFLLMHENINRHAGLDGESAKNIINILESKIKNGIKIINKQ